MVQSKKKRKQEALGRVDISESLKLLRKMEQMHDAVERGVAAVCEERGWSPAFIREHLDNPDRFATAQAWSDVQKRREELRHQLPTLQRAKSKSSAKKTLTAAARGLPTAKAQRARVRGQRRRWLSM